MQMKITKRMQILMGVQHPHNFPAGRSSPDAPTYSRRMYSTYLFISISICILYTL